MCGRCNNGTMLIRLTFKELSERNNGYKSGFICNICSNHLNKKYQIVYHCFNCDYDVCQFCAYRNIQYSSISFPPLPQAPNFINPYPNYNSYNNNNNFANNYINNNLYNNNFNSNNFSMINSINRNLNSNNVYNNLNNNNFNTNFSSNNGLNNNNFTLQEVPVSSTPENLMSAPIVGSNLIPNPTTTQKETDKISEKDKEKLENLKCSICLTEEKCMLFMPCKHISCCEGCSRAINDCPLCRQKITSKIKIFM